MKKVLFAIGGIVVGGFALLMVVGSMAGSTEKSHARDVIAECRKTVNDELLDKGTRLFARGTCEKLEADFKTKYGSRP